MKRQINPRLVAAILGSSALCVTVLSIDAQAASQAAEAHEIVATTYYNTFTRAHPVLKRVRPGDTVRTKTLDASGRDDKGVRAWAAQQSVDGTVLCGGRRVGRHARHPLHKGEVESQLGVYGVSARPLFRLTPESIQRLYPSRYKEGLVIPGVRMLCPGISTWSARPSASGVTRKRYHSVGIPCETHGWDVSVSRPLGISRRPPDHPAPMGGNLDYNEIGEGTLVLLPVYHPGALLFVGDGHALQGDGEPTGNGIETSLDVEFEG